VLGEARFVEGATPHVRAVSDTEVAVARSATPGLVISRKGRPMF
jgi:hypothetical protein